MYMLSHTCRHPCTRPCTHACMRTHMCRYLCTCLHTCPRVCRHSCIHTHVILLHLCGCFLLHVPARQPCPPAHLVFQCWPPCPLRPSGEVWACSVVFWGGRALIASIVIKYSDMIGTDTSLDHMPTTNLHPAPLSPAAKLRESPPTPPISTLTPHLTRPDASASWWHVPHREVCGPSVTCSWPSSPRGPGNGISAWHLPVRAWRSELHTFVELVSEDSFNWLLCAEAADSDLYKVYYASHFSF